jgi:hypothetical protein
LLDNYYQSFSRYLTTGELSHLASVFPNADNLAAAAVYRNGFLRACVDALRASYPVVDILVGKDYFDVLARGYIDICPPQRATFIGYGEKFPEYLSQCHDQHKLSYLPDFAKMDKSWLEVYFAADAMLLTEQSISAWQMAGNELSALHAVLPEAAALLKLDHAMCSLWSALKGGEGIENKTTFNRVPEQVLIWRDAQMQIIVQAVSGAEFAFLSSLMEGGGSTLHQAATAAMAKQNDFPFVDYFSMLLGAGLLAQKQ